MITMTLFYYSMAAIGSVGALLLGKSLHNSGRIRKIENGISEIKKDSEIKEIVESELKKLSH